jgi:glycosyltransferase involved in cell wall biosynthesis
VTQYLVHKVEDSYCVKPPKVSILPNIIDLDPGEIRKSETPSVIFLARLDPYKRPWLVVELARSFPEVDFYLCGKSHVSGIGAWEPKDLPENVHLMGHADEDEKRRLLSSAWVLVNTSMHEGLAVSFQEALRCETPILSSVDPQGVATAYGIYAGYWEGTGLEALPSFRAGLQKLLDDNELRSRLGRAGREWVQRTHTPELFYSAFRELCLEAGVRGAEDLPTSVGPR